MFGTLVVCLSSPFTGGALVTRHNDLEIIYDWSTSSDQELQWAAFYGDVEHEINQVTEGNRVTLTYNLYASDCDSSACTVLDVSNTPFYKNLKAVLQCPDFLRCGGTLGIQFEDPRWWCEKLLPKPLVNELLWSNLSS